MCDITLEIRLKPAQAKAYLRWLTSQYEKLMAACWFDDKYRYTPQGLRGPKILADHPHIAGLNRTMRELVKLLKEAGVPA
ncbi:hypothetical protein [Stutzerimonas stutzeri]|uniref:Uncharacterized protein n=1 Tax=Stutzerimonas stutzeri TaxID=316 RepID=A0A6I6LRN8_STUST|nr:hypothetical protein [Stutzerimonas stutzeri]QGZ31467.1 hypothetical protein GQA94_15860 [Stutzerimonas stutzeri]